MKPTRQPTTLQGKARAGRKARPDRSAGLPFALLILGGLLLVGVALISFSRAGARAENPQPARVGAPLNDFSLTTTDGRTVRLSDYRGQVVLVNAWATWCPPCRAEMPALNAYYQQHAAQGFVILAINAGDPAADAAAFARDYGLAFPVLLDPQLALLDRMNVRSFPTSILVGRDGQVKDIHIGMLRPEQIEEKVTPLLR